MKERLRVAADDADLGSFRPHELAVESHPVKHPNWGRGGNLPGGVVWEQGMRARQGLDSAGQERVGLKPPRVSQDSSQSAHPERQFA